MDLENVKNSIQIHRMLNRHLDTINNINQFFADAVKVFIPENNLGHEAIHMRNMIKHRYNLTTFCHKRDVIGFRKDAATADRYVDFCEDHLRTNKLLFSSHLFTKSHGYTNASVKIELQEQMERYSTQIELPKNEWGKVKRKISGKGNIFFFIHSNHLILAGGSQDDLLISFLQCMYVGMIASKAPAICFA